MTAKASTKYKKTNVLSSIRSARVLLLRLYKMVEVDE